MEAFLWAIASTLIAFVVSDKNNWVNEVNKLSFVNWVILIAAFVVPFSLVQLLKYISEKRKDNIKTSSKWKRKDLNAVIDLYNREYSEEKDPNRCPPEDLRRWIKEGNNYKNERDDPWVDFLITAKKHLKLDGFLIATHYYSFGFTFISYLVAENNHDPETPYELFKELGKMPFKNQKIVAEISCIKNEDKNHEFKIWKDKASEAKYNMIGLNEVPYIEPNPLFKDEGDPRRRMLLVYAEKKVRNIFYEYKHPSKEEIKEILRYVYLKVYYDSPEINIQESRDYLKRLHDSVVLEYENSIKNSERQPTL